MEKIILDCDPGHDDAMAIMLAVGNPKIDLVGVTTVGGNQSLEKVTYNARSVLEMAKATDIHRFTARPVWMALNCRFPPVLWIPAMP